MAKEATPLICKGNQEWARFSIAETWGCRVGYIA